MVNLKRISVIRVSGFSSYTKFLSSRSDVNLLLKSIVFFSSVPKNILSKLSVVLIACLIIVSPISVSLTILALVLISCCCRLINPFACRVLKTVEVVIRSILVWVDRRTCITLCLCIVSQ